MYDSELGTKININENELHVVIGQWDFSMDYARNGAALITSIFENTKYHVIIHIFHNEEIGLKNIESYNTNKKRYSEIANNYSANIIYHSITLPEWINTDKRQRFQLLTPGALFRLYIPEILYELDRVIYLDCDMIVTTDLSDVWNINLNNKSLGACRDINSASYVFKRYGNTYNSLGIIKEDYFNSGFLIMNLNKIRQLNILPEKGLQFLYDHSNDVECLDQDALNYLFKGDVNYLDAKYNIFTRALNSYPDEFQQTLELRNYADCCLHYYGQMKPWKFFLGKIDLPYLYYLSLTPWGNSYEKYMDNMQIVLPKDLHDAVNNKYPIMLRSQGVTRTFYNILNLGVVVITYYGKAICKVLRNKLSKGK